MGNKREDTFNLNEGVFKQYMTSNSNGNNYYGYMNGKQIITNCHSIYRFNSHFSVDLGLPVDKALISKVKQLGEQELIRYWINTQQIMGCHRDRVSTVSITDDGLIIRNYNGIEIAFDTKEINYLKNFLTKDVEVYLSEKAPMICGESKIGTGYILAKLPRSL